MDNLDNDDNGITLTDIIEKFQHLNENININKSQLIEYINYIFTEYDNIKNKKNIEEEEDINIPYENQLNTIDFSLIAKMMYYNKKCFNFIPRKIQIISLLYFINKDEKNGLIQQVDTGEGKSVIISFLAVYNAKTKNKKIDILTSSPILAKRDALLFKQFYQYFNLTVDYTDNHNSEAKSNNMKYTHDPYNCYKSDIVYGDTLSFEGDILRTNFMGILGRGKERKFDCIIIDEIDNIALDNLKNTTELLDSFHGFKFLEYVYLFISKKLKEITQKIKKNEALEKRDDIIKQLYDESQKEFSDFHKLEDKNIFIPNHLKNYIHNRLNDWCESAFTAKYIYHENENYIIKKDNENKIDVINPIDFYNTGVTQENSVWAGLHQFLQIHEKKMITEENLSSCYMSNLSFFKMYIHKDENNNIIENNIYGVTGTIGSKYNKLTLKELYNLSTLVIPSFKESLLKIEKPTIILITDKKEENQNKKNENQISYEDQWLNNIENKIINIIEKNRAVLVIFQYISEAIRMNKILRNKNKNFLNNTKIILYVRSDRDEGNFLEDYIDPKYIILSTNISGRGTNIKISPQLNNNGGLHVILTYEPFNKRIERQAFGRAGRKGENGSAEKIIISHMTEEEAIKEINNREEKESDFLINAYKYKIEVFEKIFNRFSKFITEIYERTHDEILLLDLKERWGLFLIENNLNNIEKKYKKDHNSIDAQMFKNIEKEYDNFEQKLNNFYYGYSLGFEYKDLTKIFLKTKNIVKSIDKEEYKYMNGLYLNKSKDINKINQAIKKCPNLCLGGYMFKIIENINKINSTKNQEEKQYLFSSIDKVFIKLIKKINLLIEQFNYYETIIGYLGYNKENLELSQQNKQKIKLMTQILELMENNKEVINNNKKNNCKINLKHLSLKKLIEHFNLNINNLVIEYFQEYGLCLFILTDKKNNDNNNCYIY